MTGDRSSTLLTDGDGGGGEARKRGGGELGMMEEEQLPDRGDFGGGDFLEDLGGLGGLELGEVPSVGDITLDEGHKGKEAGDTTGQCTLYIHV